MQLLNMNNLFVVACIGKWIIDTYKIKAILSNLENKHITINQAMDELRDFPYEDIGFAKIDHHRSLRKDFPEVIFGQGKTLEQIRSIVEKQLTRNDTILITRTNEDVYKAIRQKVAHCSYDSDAKAIIIDQRPLHNQTSTTVNINDIIILTAGTSDLPVAKEAAIITELMGTKPREIYDVGVAGLHRVIDHLPILRTANVVIIVAGMDGVLPSVVGGLIESPIIAVPTSIGYGANFQGLSALLTMLNSCSPGISVVNIDNGFGAGYLASIINRKITKE